MPSFGVSFFTFIKKNKENHLLSHNPSKLTAKGIDFNKFKESKTEFRGAVFFNTSKIDNNIDTSERMYKVFKDKKGLIECEPIPGRQKIPLKFHKTSDKSQESFEINFDEL